MSNHLFKTQHNGEKATVLAGWDRPLQGYFLVIFKEYDEDDRPFYSNILDEKETHPKTLKPFLKVLDKYGIKVPEQMIQEILEDGENDIGNKTVFHNIQDDGSYTREEKR